ncbi:hypothetical protein DFH07DRAFT_965345 [Mycena maculata]|uniref:Uncharacterized protein n=1 Tax=Mycena maculata TaxID=230809 RepID=A0AAD7IEZ6_9AGAR|nr:hypothetical protein DFH07DRAFT_965345 [Mycena maculata]
MNLSRRGRHKGRVASAATSSASVVESPSPFRALAPDVIRDAIQIFIHLLNKSADACPPLKSAAGGVLAVWDLADRVSASDGNAQVLAWRALDILDTIYNAVGDGSHRIPPGMLPEIQKFEKLLLEISAAMEAQLKPGWARRVLHLRRHESELARFTSRLIAVSEAFKIGSSARVELAVDKIQGSSTRVELAVVKIQADVSSTAALAGILEQSNIRLRTEVHVLRTVVLFGLSPVSHQYTGRLCVHGAPSHSVHVEEI